MKKTIELGYVYPALYDEKVKSVPLYPAWYRERRLDPESVIEDVVPGSYRLKITYPLVTPVTKEVTFKRSPTRQQIADIVAEMYVDAYGESLGMYHGIGDLTVTDVTIQTRKGARPLMTFTVQS